MNNLVPFWHQLSWKWTIARKLSTEFGLWYADVDDEIVRRKLWWESIYDYSKRLGDIWQDTFRPFESEIFSILLKEARVVSPGGWTLTFQNNIDIIPNDAIKILLDISVDEQMKRHENDIEGNKNRGVLLNQDGWINLSDKDKKRIELDFLREKRQPWFEALADLKVIVDGKTPAEITAEILNKVELSNNRLIMM